MPSEVEATKVKNVKSRVNDVTDTFKRDDGDEFQIGRERSCVVGSAGKKRVCSMCVTYDVRCDRGD